MDVHVVYEINMWPFTGGNDFVLKILCLELLN